MRSDFECRTILSKTARRLSLVAATLILSAATEARAELLSTFSNPPGVSSGLPALSLFSLQDATAAPAPAQESDISWSTADSCHSAVTPDLMRWIRQVPTSTSIWLAGNGAKSGVSTSFSGSGPSGQQSATTTDPQVPILQLIMRLAEEKDVSLSPSCLSGPFHPPRPV